MTEKNKIKPIKKGTKVSWASSGRGSRKKKTGEVVRFLDTGVDVQKFLPKNTPVSQIMTRIYASSHQRYLVKVPTGKDKHVFFTPRAVTIHEQNTAGKKTTKKTSKKTKAQ